MRTKEDISIITGRILDKIKDYFKDGGFVLLGHVLVLVQDKQLVREVRLAAAKRFGDEWLKMDAFTPRSFCLRLLRCNYKRYNARFYEHKRKIEDGAEFEPGTDEDYGYPLYGDFRVLEMGDNDYNSWTTFGVYEDYIVNDACNMFDDFTDLYYQYQAVIDQEGNLYDPINEGLDEILRRIDNKYRGKKHM